MAPVDVPDATPAAMPNDAAWWTQHPVAVDDEKWIPGKGLGFASQDGLFAVALRLRAQFLYEVERAYDTEAGARRDPQQNLTVRRARITFAGHMWGDKTQYKVELAVSPNDIGFAHAPDSDDPPINDSRSFPTRSLLLDWYLQFGQIRDLNFRLGQYKVPYSRERVASSGDLQFVDRSILNREFTVDRDIGFDFRSKDLFGLDKRLRYYLGVYNGDGHSQYELGDFGLMYVGRVEFLPFGSFDDYSQSDLERTKSARMSVGASYARVQHGAGRQGILGRPPADDGTTDYDNVTADAIFKYRGISVEGAYYWRQGDRNPGSALDASGLPVPVEAARNGWGAGGQLGYLLPDVDIEIAARYGAVRGQGARASTSLREQNEGAVALSYYFARHSYKLQGDWGRVWGEGASDGGLEFADGLDRYRVQLQAAF